MVLIGDDPDGRVFLGKMEEERMALSGLRKMKTPTGQAIIYVDRDGNNSIVVNAGANFAMGETELASWKESLRACFCCILQMEIPLPILEETISFCQQEGILVILNAAPVNPAFAKERLADLDYLVVNENELLQMSGEEEEEAAIQSLLDAGVGHLLYTIGEKGSLLITKEERLSVPAFKVKAVDTTGAGDTYIGAFAAQLQTETPENAMRYATAASALAVQKVGAAESIPSDSEIRAFLEK